MLLHCSWEQTLLRSFILWRPSGTKKSGPGITEVFANVIYKGDIVVLKQEKSGRIIVESHETKFENRDNEITGAYSIIIKDGVAYYEIMTMKEIQASWNKRSNSGQGSKRTSHKKWLNEQSSDVELTSSTLQMIQTLMYQNLIIANL